MELTPRTRNAIVAATTLVLATLAGCAANGDNGAGDGTTRTVDMVGAKYAPGTLNVPVGATVRWVNLDPVPHTVTPTDPDQWGTPGSGDDPSTWLGKDDAWSFTFDTPGTYTYYCIPHAVQREDGTWTGMVATVVVGAGDASYTPPDVTVVPDPVAVPVATPGLDGKVHLDLTAQEVVGQLDDRSAFEFWTFDGTVPGPMLRVREGDVVEVSLTNLPTSRMTHNIDLHAVTGPGGGAKATEVAPGETKSFTFTATHPGLFVYHCATPPVPAHVANGMYGMILVEPAGGLPPADREYYVVQGEVYTAETHGTTGLLTFDPDRLRDEDPEYFLFNGRVGALTGDGALTARVGETVRIYFGVGGAVPSSFHVIGEVFDRVYMDGSLAGHTEHRQTVMVPAAGAAIVDFEVEYPGTYVLVDHTLSRVFDKGALGLLEVTGAADPSIFDDGTG